MLRYAVSVLAFNPSVATALTVSEIPKEDNSSDPTEVSDPTEIVVTASGFNQRKNDTGHAITVIDRQTLERTQTKMISDILATVPGVRVARNGGVGGVTSVFIRGGESSQTLVLIDGVRVNDPSSPNALFDFGSLLTNNIGRVEVLRGSNSVIWGNQAIGGVVNIRSIEPGGSFALNANAEYGYRNTGSIAANVSGGNHVISGSAGAGYFRTDGISTLENGTENDGYKGFSANGKIRIQFADYLGLDLRTYYNRSNIEFDDPFSGSQDSFPETTNKQFVGYIGLNADFDDNRLQNRIAYSRTDLRRQGREPNVPFSFNVNNLKGVIDRFEYRGSFHPFEPLSMVVGLEYERSFASTYFPASGNPAPDTARTSVRSAFGQISVKPTAGLTLTGGLRHDDYTEYGGKTTFGVNFAYSFNQGTTVFRGNFAEGFRAPTLTEALLPFGNTSLRPETARGFDFGIEQTLFDGALEASARYFRRTSDDLISFSFTTFRSENIAFVRSEGLDLNVVIRPTTSLQINSGYSLVDSRSRTIGSTFNNRLARRPKHNVNLSIDWVTPWSFTVGSSISLTGDAFDDIANTVPLDGYALAAVRASFPISGSLELFGRIENAFGANYQTAAGFNSLGRNAYIGVRVKR